MKTKTKIEMPDVHPIPFNSDCGYIKRVFRWFFYTRKWEMSKDWCFVLFSGVTILIPKGFQFDGASVPKPFRSLLSPTGILFIPGIIHDYAYKHNSLMGITSDGGGAVTFSPYRKKAGKLYWDWLFMRIAQQVCGLFIIPKVAYAVLVLFGFFAWYKHRRLR